MNTLNIITASLLASVVLLPNLLFIAYLALSDKLITIVFATVLFLSVFVFFIYTEATYIGGLQ